MDGRKTCRSAIVSLIPAQCSTFFGHPYTPPGTRPNRFFILSAAPAQGGVFILGMDTRRSQPSTVLGRYSELSLDCGRARRTRVISSRLRSVNSDSKRGTVEK